VRIICAVEKKKKVEKFNYCDKDVDMNRKNMYSLYILIVAVIDFLSYVLPFVSFIFLKKSYILLLFVLLLKKVEI
jgi:hypothetical protein